MIPEDCALLPPDSLSLPLRLLTRQIGEVPEELRSRINTLSLEQLENLGEALLEFEALSDIKNQGFRAIFTQIISLQQHFSSKYKSRFQ